MKKWLTRYDQGEMDSVLASMGITRKPLDGPRASTAVLLNDALKEKLVGMGKEVVSQMPGSQIIAMGNDFRTALGLKHVGRSKGWSSRQRTKALKGMKEGGGTLIVEGSLMDMIGDKWKGATPDTFVDDKGSIIEDPLSFERHHHLLSTSSKKRRFIANRYFRKSHQDKARVNIIDLREIGMKKVKINIENAEQPVDIGCMPAKSANRLRVLLKCLYITGKRSKGGVGFSKNDLSNTGNNRSKAFGLMTSFGYKDMGILYANSREDCVKEGNSSYRILGEIEGIIFDFLQTEYPEVLKAILADNKHKFKDSVPPYAVESGKFVSPRMIISSRLGNEAHIDFGDNGLSFVVWLAEDPTEDVGDWKFIMQNLRTDVDGSVRDTTTIQLFDGIVMVYDGRYIHHATSIPESNRGNI